MRFFKWLAATGLVLMVATPAALATQAAAQPAAQPDTASEPEKARETAPEEKTSSSAASSGSGDAAADPTSTASTSPRAEPQADARAGKPLSLTIASWGGAYAQSQERAFIDPFREQTGASVTLVDHGGAFAGLKNGAWDVVDLGQAELRKACNEGLLERIGPDDIAAAGGATPLKDDFLPGGVQDCGIATMAWSAAIAFDRKAFEKEQPASAADFFDIGKFPGSRALPNDPKYVLPLALMADGVAPDEVYKTLESREGIERALARLDAIRGDIVWWRNADEALKPLTQDKATMALAFSGRIFYAIVRDGQPLGVIWDGQIYDLDLWAIPKNAPNRDAALEFIAFSMQPERLSAQTEWFPYGPMRKSALAGIGRHAVTDVAMDAYVPTTDANFRRALRVKPEWWAEHGERLAAALDAWMTAPAADAAEGAAEGADTGADAE